MDQSGGADAGKVCGVKNVVGGAGDAGLSVGVEESGRSTGAPVGGVSVREIGGADA